MGKEKQATREGRKKLVLTIVARLKTIKKWKEDKFEDL
jgi:hypothetical protein